MGLKTQKAPSLKLSWADSKWLPRGRRARHAVKVGFLRKTPKSDDSGGIYEFWNTLVSNFSKQYAKPILRH